METSEVTTPEVTETQIDDPSAENFDYDSWSKSVFKEPDDEIDLDAMQAESEEGEEDHDESDDGDSDDDRDESDDKKKQVDQKTEKQTKENDQDKNPKLEVKLKVNGEERIVKDPEEIQKLAQLGLASTENFRAAQNIQQQTRELFETLRDNPAKIFSNPSFGPKFREAAEKYIYDELKLEYLRDNDPDGYDQEIKSRRLAQYEEEEQTRGALEKQRQFEEQTNHFKAQFAQNLADIMENSQIPDTTDNRLLVGQQMRKYVEKGLPIDVVQISKDVAERFHTNINSSLSALDAKALVEKLGPEAVDKIRKYNLQKLKDKTEASSKPQLLKDKGGSKGGGRRAKKTFNSADDFMDDVWSGYS